PLAPGRYCFRAEWPGDINYSGPVTHTDSTLECFDVAKLDTQTVTTPVDGSGTAESSITLGDTIFDRAVVTGTAAGGDPTGAVNGTLSFTLYDGAVCSGTVLRAAEQFPISNYTNPTNATTATTTNSTVRVSASETVSWSVVFTSSDPNVSSSSACEVSQLTITN